MSNRRPNYPYTCPGLGDRIHSVLLGYQYGKRHESPVTIHLTKDKFDKHKPGSWREVVALFPEGSVRVQPHPVSLLGEEEWIAYLKDKGIAAETYYYGDALNMNRLDAIPWVTLDIAPFLNDYPCLPLRHVPEGLALPDKFVTQQWDGSGPRRTLDPQRRKKVIGNYREQGFEVVTLGGDSEDSRLGREGSLASMAYAISNASFHVGVDSGIMHLASLFLRPEQIHLYGTSFTSHHFVRAKNNGCVINKYAS